VVKTGAFGDAGVGGGGGRLMSEVGLPMFEIFRT